jgi:hypothetical protein
MLEDSELVDLFRIELPARERGRTKAIVDDEA